MSGWIQAAMQQNTIINMYLGPRYTQFSHKGFYEDTKYFHSIRWKSGPLAIQVWTFGEGYTLYKKPKYSTYFRYLYKDHRELEWKFEVMTILSMRYTF